MAEHADVIPCRSFYRHLDEHKLWVPNEFAVKCFKIIMFSVQVSSKDFDTDTLHQSIHQSFHSLYTHHGHL